MVTAHYLGSAGCWALNMNDSIFFVFMLCVISVFYSVLILLFCRIFFLLVFSLESLKPNVNLASFAFWLNFQTQEYFCVSKHLFPDSSATSLTHLGMSCYCLFAKFWYLKQLMCLLYLRHTRILQASVC